MARKSRKHPELTVPVSKDTVGYIRLSVFNRDSHGSVENQKLIIEEWGKRNEIIISRYYIDNGFSGKRFQRPGFKEMLADIEAGHVKTVIVKDMSRFGRNYLEVGMYTMPLPPAGGAHKPLQGLTQVFAVLGCSSWLGHAVIGRKRPDKNLPHCFRFSEPFGRSQPAVEDASMITAW